MPRILDPSIAALPVFDETGQPHALRTCWAQGTAVIAFLRHFG